MSRTCDACDEAYGTDERRGRKKCENCPERDRKVGPRQMDLEEWLDKREAECES